MVETRIVPPPADLPQRIPAAVSPEAWTAIHVLAVLAGGPAAGAEIAHRLSLDALTVLPLLEIVEDTGLVDRHDRVYRLAVPAAAISIAAIVRAVDGDVPRGGAAQADDTPAIAEIQRRIAVAMVGILDNFSLAEAAGDLSECRGEMLFA